MATAKETMDALWKVDGNKPMVPDQLTQEQWMNLFLLAEMGNYFYQWVYGGPDAPSPMDADMDDKALAAWKESHPNNHLDQDPLAKTIIKSAKDKADALAFKLHCEAKRNAP